MSVHQSEALTLRAYPYSESHKIVVFLTRRYGKVRGVAHGVQKPRSRFSGSLEPLTHVRLTFSRKEHQELAVIQNCEIVQAFPAYQFSWEVNLHFSYFSELLVEFSKEEEDSELLFRLSLAVLQASQELPIELLARYFELWILKLEGVLPPLDQKLTPELALKVSGMMKLQVTEVETAGLSQQECKRLENLCSELVECHLEKRLKTRKFLTQLL